MSCLPSCMPAYYTNGYTCSVPCYSSGVLCYIFSLYKAYQAPRHPHLRCYWLMMFNLAILFFDDLGESKIILKALYPVILCHGTSKNDIVCCTNLFICYIYFTILKKIWTPGIVHVVHDVTSSPSQIFGEKFETIHYRHRLLTTHHELAKQTWTCVIFPHLQDYNCMAECISNSFKHQKLTKMLLTNVSSGWHRVASSFIQLYFSSWTVCECYAWQCGLAIGKRFFQLAENAILRLTIDNILHG